MMLELMLPRVTHKHNSSIALYIVNYYLLLPSLLLSSSSSLPSFLPSPSPPLLLLQQDGVTLDYVRAQLEECSAEHSVCCLGQPVFTLETTLGMHNIIMTCPLCEYMVIIV